MTSGHSPNLGVGMFSSPATEVEEPTFELVEKVKKNVWIVTRKGDPRREKYLASPSSPFGVKPDGTVDVTQTLREAEALNTLLSKHNQAYTIRQILNHENLISIAGFMENRPFNKSQTSDATPENNVQMLVWDFGDAGNLSALFRHYPCESSEFYLPESLCWHVLRSLTRAVAYLHDGKWLSYRPEHLGRHMVREWVSVNTDWFPILHRCIEPRNVWLQHPRGIETYGQCKLGGYSHAAVTCHTVDAQFNPHTVRSDSNGMALATKEGIWRLDDARSVYDVVPASIPNEVGTQ
jgi:serine/threonine protein kinase